MRLGVTAVSVALFVAGCPKSAPSPKPELPSKFLVEKRTADLQSKIDTAVGKAPDRPRTRHVLASGQARFSNRLALEASPYLQQHAHNPVDWFPWHDDTFALAKKLDRPVLLSVGYSTCHWCHVMEEESFEDLEIAAFINANFVPIKVDREQRPDVDSVYMEAVRILTRGGGWPMTVWLTPDGRAFFGGTYFPPRKGARGSRRGFLELLAEQSKSFKNERAKVEESASRLMARVERQLAQDTSGDVDDSIVSAAIASAQRAYDPEHHGARQSRKFPSSLPLRFLIRVAGDSDRYGSSASRAKAMVSHTLDEMARGGIYDHIGGGFHRYTVDPRWEVPHFEKMLYDNALLLVAYSEASETMGATGKEDWQRVIQETADWVLREMRHADGYFYGAQDADSMAPTGHREEGYFYSWSTTELDRALGEKERRLWQQRFRLTPFEGRHIFFAKTSVDKLGATADPGQDVAATLATARSKLYKVRAQRPAPLTDEKLITAWNALMISGLVHASAATDDATKSARYMNAALKAMEFLRSRLFNDGLARTFLDGKAEHQGVFEDYAFLAAASLDLYAGTEMSAHLDFAEELAHHIKSRFVDPTSGAFVVVEKGRDPRLPMEHPRRDGAVPSATSVHLRNLVRLRRATHKPGYESDYRQALTSVGGLLGRSPGALFESFVAIAEHQSAPH